jgi:outer membrane protein assembly factor BamB
MVRFSAFTALFVAAVLAPALAADWTQFRGPGGLGTSPDRGVPLNWNQNENILWKTDLPGAGTSSPVFLGDKIFLTAYSGYNVPGQPQGSQNDLKRHLLCLDRRSGRIAWTKNLPVKLPEQDRIREGHGYASSTPAVDAERVYVFAGRSGVLALDHSGKQLWQADVGNGLSGWGSASSPLLSGDLVIVNASVESQSLIAFQKTTGKEKWRAGGIRESWNTPILVQTKDGKTELVVAIMGKVLGFDPATGQQLWNCATEIGWYMVPSLVAHNDVVYCIGGRNGGGALAVRAGGRGDVTRTHRLWAIKKGSNVPSPVFHEGHLYWINETDSIAYCVEAASGRIVYGERIPHGGQVYASALLADGRIYHIDRSGRTYVIAAKPKFELLATNELRDRSMFNATPVAVDGKLYIRSDKALYCIGK